MNDHKVKIRGKNRRNKTQLNVNLPYAVCIRLSSVAVNKRQNSFSSFENKMRSPYGHSNMYDINESNGRMDGGEPMIIPRKHVSDSQMSSVLDRRHLEDVTNHQQDQQQQQLSSSPLNRSRDANKALIIDDALTKLDPVRINSRFISATATAR